MEEVVRKYFWTVPVVVVMVCGVLSAKAVNHVLEEKLLADAEKAPPISAPAIATSTTPASKGISKASQPFVDRNMFCSACVPVEPVVEGEESDLGHPRYTTLPLRLVATHVSTIPEYSMATVLNTSSSRQGAYAVGQTIPDGGEILRIGNKYVDFRNSSSRREERIGLLSAEAPVVAKTEDSSEPLPARTASSQVGANDEMASLIESGVKQIDDTTFELDKKVVDKVLENPLMAAKGARIVPSIKDGKANGFKLYAIRPSSMYAKIGLRNGDTIHSINGYELSSPDKALEVYTKLREATSLSVTATRRGQPVKLNYSIR